MWRDTDMSAWSRTSRPKNEATILNDALIERILIQSGVTHPSP
jgi:hypothetical protein